MTRNGPKKIIQDSDDDEDDGSASASPIKATEASDSTIINPSDSPPNQAPPRRVTSLFIKLIIPTELLTREIHNAQQSLTETTPEDKIPTSTLITETQRSSTSPVLSRNKRRKTTMGIKEVYPEASKFKRQKSTKVYGSKSGSQNGFDFHGSDEEIEHGSKERTKPVRDEWEFPSSSASNDPLAPRREAGSTRVKSRNADGDTILVNSDLTSGKKRSNSVVTPPETRAARVQAFEGSNGASTEFDNSQHAGKLMPQKRSRRRKTIHDDRARHKEGPSSSLEHGKMVDSTDDSGLLAQSSFQIDLTRPTLVLTASQKEQHEQISVTTPITGSLPPPLGDEAVFVDPYVKLSDESSTIVNTTPLKELQNEETDINITKTFSKSKTAPDMSVSSIPIQTPRKVSQTGSERSRTSRRSKTSIGLHSPRNDKSTSSASPAGTQTSLPSVKPKRRSKTTTSAVPQQTGEEVSLDDLSLPASVCEATNSRAQKSKNKRKAKDVTDTPHADELGSDDIAVGLPKEQYKPRPSRSRWNPVVDDILENVDFSKRPEAQAKAKNKRRKTNDSELAHISKEAAPLQAVRDGEDGTAEHPVDTKQPAAVSLEKDIVLKEDIVEEVEIETQPAAKKGPRLKRKIIVDEENDGDADTGEVHAQVEHKVAEIQMKSKTKKPAPKARGRPRKKTEEEKIPICEEKVVVDNEVAEHSADEVMLVKPLEDGQKVLEDTDVNSTLGADPIHTTDDCKFHNTPAEQGTTPPQEPTTPVQTPRKAPQKGPDKHSPLNSGKVPYRVGLSKRAKIEPLLRILKK